MSKDRHEGARYLPPHYHPRSVVLSMDQMGNHIVTDRSYGNDHAVNYGPDKAAAQRMVSGRQATIKGALTRRQNKREVLRNAEADKAGVTRSWLREELTAHEADAWLGLDFTAKED